MNEGQLKREIEEMKKETKILEGVLEIKDKKEIEKRIENLKKKTASYEEVLLTQTDNKMGRPVGSSKYTSEQTEFLKQNKNVPIKDLIVLFNKKFNLNLPLDTRILYNFMFRAGIIDTSYSREYIPRNPTATQKGIETKQKRKRETKSFEEEQEERVNKLNEKIDNIAE